MNTVIPAPLQRRIALFPSSSTPSSEHQKAATVVRANRRYATATINNSDLKSYHRHPYNSHSRQMLSGGKVVNLLYLLLIFTVVSSPYLTTNAALLQGCNFDETLCDKGEICIPDGLFGQCYSDGESEVLKPLVIEKELDAFQQELLRLELKRLANNGLNWPHARSQCILAYFKFTVVYDLDYDAQFCAVRNPNNIWALIQEVQNVLATESEEKEALFRDSLIRNGLLLSGDDQRVGPGSDVEALLLRGAPQPPPNAVAYVDNNNNNEEDSGLGAAEEPSADAYLADDDGQSGGGAFPAVLVGDAAGSYASAAGDEQEESQQVRPANASDVFAAAMRQLGGIRDAEQKRSANGQVAIDLEENVVPDAGASDYENLFAQIPRGLVLEAVERSDDEDAPAPDADRAAAWNAWLASVLSAGGGGRAAQPQLPQLSAGEEKQLDDYVTDILNNRRPDLKELSDNQLEKLIAFINSLKLMLQQKAAQLQKEEELSAPEIEEVIPLTSQNNEKQLLLKKDSEKFNNADMGLANTVHKIVKGGIQRVEGNRVYLKVAPHAEKPLTEQELYKLIDFLDRKIAEPNDLFFDEFVYENGQLSFRVSRIKFVSNLQQIFENFSADEAIDDESAAAKNLEAGLDAAAVAEKKDDKTGDGAKKGSAKQLENASGVAQAVYKRRKDIQSLSGIDVDETGIGSGVDIVPVESARRDWLFVPVVAICGISLATLISVLAIQYYRARRVDNTAGGLCGKKSDDLPEVIDYIEGKPATIYEDLCRQRMSAADPVLVSVNVVGPSPGCVATTSKHSSTSSWPDDTYLQSCNLDISTGHVILGFLKDCLEKPDEISNQWSQLADYENTSAQKTVANEPQNSNKNFDDSVVPYDDALVTVSPSSQFRLRSRPSSNDEHGTVLVDLHPSPSHERSGAQDQDAVASSGARKYVNASRICDADPRQMAYIAAQAPVSQTVADFWGMIWQEGVVVVVNLTDWSDGQQSSLSPVRYWPRDGEGSRVYGALEVNLVSEHSFNKDYVVRSIYLKNLNTLETRTVTQFHYVSWPEAGLPKSIESLLEFRRKVNKSYRGHASPVLVHCTNGAGRTGAYILIDVVMNRILKGVKELNIAGSLEHLRDQRMRLIENEAQYKLVFRCVAEEVSSLLKNLQH